ncbi:MAG TPA: bifunctional adenosylcobinamide kinase/adenosylcobinamide-phosphate guanylyltransferase [Pirellulaceae bacterium]|nr:bifunctional adenosylcobinamide kinase/adenosylcobinamide-phosphate guanylyltransferase [Pirellulaceae bacterium]
MAKIVLILGGVRSGKSRFAQQLAERLGGDDVLFVATAEAGDAEMARRIQIHRTARPTAWQTIEAAGNVGAALQQAAPHQQTILIDCLTLLVSNVLLNCGENPDSNLAERQVATEIENLLDACGQRSGTVIMVSGEVGLGLVPESPLGRLYRDLLGWANQAVAARSDATYWLIAGLPIELQALAVTVEQAAAPQSSPDTPWRESEHAATAAPSCSARKS